MTNVSNKIVDQVNYLGRWVNKENFRVYVYSKNDKKLVNSYKEYEEALASKEWFPIQEECFKKNKKQKYEENITPENLNEIGESENGSDS